MPQHSAGSRPCTRPMTRRPKMHFSASVVPRPNIATIASAMSHEATELIIQAGHTERNYWRDLFRFRELFYFLAWRDVLVRYKQTVIGVLWAVLRPLLSMLVLTFA